MSFKINIAPPPAHDAARVGSAPSMLGAALFLATYLLVSARRLRLVPLDRPAAALLGAVACVALGAVPPEDAIAAIDGETLLLLFGMMTLGAFLAADGFFDRAGDVLAARAGDGRRLLGAIVWGAGVFAALVTNDAVCVLGAPVVVAVVRRHRLPPLPFLLALATAANTGSVATLVGNPQNMLCATLGDLDYLEHLVALAPVAVVSLALNHALLVLLFRRELATPLAAVGAAPPLWTGESLRTLGVIAATAIACALGADLAWTATGGATLLLVLQRRDPAEIWRNVDGSILLFFAGLFVVVEALVRSGVPAWTFERFPLGAGDGIGDWARVSSIFLVGSNVVSNVPFILVVREAMAGLADPRLGWELLAMASTFAGNLTLLGSVANVIVAEKARDLGGIGFFDYLRVGLPLALLSTAIGTAWLLFWLG
jgi:Na+/H+ antiporter NhaD/arsenite permease-like protein